MYSLGMNKDQIVSALRSQSDAIRALGATGLFIFGSAARNQATAASDIDVFVDYERGKGFTLVELVGIKQLLEKRLGRDIDVTTRDSLDPLLRQRIEASAERVF